jgi:hypothetical protein
VLQFEDSDFLSNLPEDHQQILLTSLPELIVGTDMQSHADFVAKTNALFFGVDAVGAAATKPQAAAKLEPAAKDWECTPANRLPFLTLILKSAECFFLFKQRQSYNMWVSRQLEELFIMGDTAGDLGLVKVPFAERAALVATQSNLASSVNNDAAPPTTSQSAFTQTVSASLYRRGTLVNRQQRAVFDLVARPLFSILARVEPQCTSLTGLLAGVRAQL